MTGIIVDGDGDYKSFKQRFVGYKILKTDGPRGDCAPLEKIISKSRKQISILSNWNCKKIIIVMDFECRKISYEDFLGKLDRQIEKAKFPIEVNFVVPNQMIENWYLADVEYLSKKKKYIKDKLQQKNYEGKNGTKELKKLFVKSYSYSKTKHGPELFKLIRKSIASKNSKSFKILLENL